MNAIAQFLLAFLVIIAFIGMNGALMFFKIESENTSTVQLITTFGGQLSTMAALIVGYYFGSSTASKGKDETIAALSGTGPGGPAAAGAGIPRNGGGVPPKPGDPGTVAVEGQVTGTLKEK